MYYAEQVDQYLDMVSGTVENKGRIEVQDQNTLTRLMKHNIFFSTSVSGMITISHMIEDEAAQSESQFNFYSDFQRFSRVKPQADRYLKILHTRNPVYIFGVPDVVLWKDPNLVEVPLDKPQNPSTPHLSRNWFVVMHSPSNTSLALVTREVTPPSDSPLKERTFEGFWTSHPKLITPIVEMLEGFMQESTPELEKKELSRPPIG